VATFSGHTRLWSADQQNLHRISVVDNKRESYTPLGIDVGIDFSVLLAHDNFTQQFKPLITNYAELRGWALAKAHARSRDAVARYLGAGQAFDRAIEVYARFRMSRTTRPSWTQ
jgi:Uncharacterized protein conserved in bacteria (DUF2252)